MSAAPIIPAKRPGKAREQALLQLGTSFKGALAAIRRLRGRDSQRPGELSFAQYHLLFGLADHDELSTGELAAAADLAPATVTQMLDSLVAMKLVDRVRSERDRRIVACSLTARGQELIAERRAYFELLWHQRLQEFSTAELLTAATVVDRLRAMYEEFDAHAHNAPVPR